MSQQELFGTFWDHLDDFRSCIIRIIVIIFCGLFFSLFFYEKIYELALYPYHSLVKDQVSPYHQTITFEKVSNLDNSSQVILLKELQTPLLSLSKNAHQIDDRHISLESRGYVVLQTDYPKLAILSPVEGFITSLKLCLWASLFITSPFWLMELFKFLSPGLTHTEKKAFLPFVLLSYLLFALGLTFAYTVTLPIASHYFYSLNSQIGVNFWSLSTYVDYFLLILFSNAFAFQFFVILIFLVHNGIIRGEYLEQKRRHFIVLAFIIGALITPPDVLTQLFLAVPLILLFEIVVLYSKVRKKNVAVQYI